jgi:Rod binding domain-containing protein
MTFPLAPAAAPAAGALDPAREREIRAAARQLEGVFMQQLMSVMRSTAGENAMFSGTGGSTWGALFDQHVGDAMADAGGVGLADVIATALGASPSRAAPPLPPMVPLNLGPTLPNRPPSGADLAGATGDLQDAARAMLGADGVAEQWGREGRLTEADLASDFVTGEPGERAHFAVRDARGYEGYYKCNLFALELTRRAGFEVPLVARHHGWGYPGPTALAEDAADGRLRGDWARVASGASPEALDSAAASGRSAFVLVGSAHGEHRGHMGVVERIHDIERDESGAITAVTFDGWEGRSRGAMHLVRRTWSVAGHRAATSPDGVPGRGGLGRIEILELRRPDPGETLERPLHSRPGASVLDGSETPEIPGSAAASRSETGSLSPPGERPSTF